MHDNTSRRLHPFFLLPQRVLNPYAATGEEGFLPLAGDLHLLILEPGVFSLLLHHPHSPPPPPPHTTSTNRSFSNDSTALSGGLSLIFAVAVIGGCLLCGSWSPKVSFAVEVARVLMKTEPWSWDGATQCDSVSYSCDLLLVISSFFLFRLYLSASIWRIVFLVLFGLR